MTSETPQMWDVINKMNDEFAEVQDENEKLKKQNKELLQELTIYRKLGDKLFEGRIVFEDFQIECDEELYDNEMKIEAVKMFFANTRLHPPEYYIKTDVEAYEFIRNKGRDKYGDENYYFEIQKYKNMNDVDVMKCICDNIIFDECLWDTKLYFFNEFN